MQEQAAKIPMDERSPDAQDHQIPGIKNNDETAAYEEFTPSSTDNERTRMPTHTRDC